MDDIRMHTPAPDAPRRDVSDWRERAACRFTDPDAFHPEREYPWSAPVRAAKRICARCPVSTQCLVYALASEPDSRYLRHGIYGGTTSQERHRMMHPEQEETA